MFKNILVPTDLTDKSLTALDLAVGISKEGSRITLLHVIETLEDIEDEEFTIFYEKLRDRALKKMDDMIVKYIREGLEIGHEILFGKRVKEIVGYAYENDIDLIVLSSHRIEKMDPREGWATISYRVGILSHCPVMMVK